MKKLIALFFLLPSFAWAACPNFQPNTVLTASALNTAIAAPCITGGTINNAPIAGGTGSFTTLTTSGLVTDASNSVFGSVTATALSTPSQPTGTPLSTGGTIAAGSNYAKIIAVDAFGGTTIASVESAAVTTTGTTSSITWTWTAVPYAINYQVWVGTVSGAESFYATTATNSYVQVVPATSLTAGTIPIVNTTGGVFGAHYMTSATGLTSAGTTQATAFQLSAQHNAFTTVGASSGAILPIPVQAGFRILVDNDGANALLLYPQVGGNIDGGTTNAAISIPVGAVWEGVYEGAGVWTTYEPIGLGTANQITITATPATNTFSLPSALIFPGNATATLGFLANGIFSGAYTDGVIVDYASTNGRISVGAADTLTIYNGGQANTQMEQIGSTGTTVTALRLGSSGSGKLAASVTAPTIASGFGTGASVTANNGTAAFTINVGTGGTASSGVVTMPAATTGWSCTVMPVAAPAAGAIMYSAPTSTTSITITNYTLSTGAALAWTASTVISVNCIGY